MIVFLTMNKIRDTLIFMWIPGKEFWYTDEDGFFLRLTEKGPPFAVYERDNYSP